MEELTPFLDDIKSNLKVFAEQFYQIVSKIKEEIVEKEYILLFPVIPRPHLLFFRTLGELWRQQVNDEVKTKHEFLFPELAETGTVIGS